MSLSEIKKALSVMITPGDVVELRIFDQNKKKFCGWFNDIDRMAEAALSHDDTAEGTYYTCNACVPGMLAIANNRIVPCETASSEGNIQRRRVFGLDIDPVRNPVKISSTDAEKALAYNRALEVKVWLSSHGFPAPVIGDSGNGYHLDYFVDLPNSPEIKKLYENVYKTIQYRFPKDRVDVQGFADANRIWKVYGTVARKGENMLDRPHRRSKLLEVPEPKKLVTIEMLQKIADMLPKDGHTNKGKICGDCSHRSSLKNCAVHHKRTGFNEAACPDYNNRIPARNSKAWDAAKLKEWLEAHGAVIERPKQDGDVTRYVLKTCLWNTEHEGHKEAEVHINSKGVIGYKCHHNSCNDITWKMIRNKYEPGYEKSRQPVNSNGFNGAFGYIDRIFEKSPIYFDDALNYWLWDDEKRLYESVDETTVLLTILKEIGDPSIIESKFKQELLQAARIRGRDAGVKKVPDEWIYFENGVIDIKTGERLEPAPEYLFTEPIPHKLNGSEETPTIDKLFGGWVNKDKIPLLYEICAYCLYNGYPIHRMFILVGRGRNGKGQFRDLLVRLVGVHNRTASTLEQLINSRFESARLEHKKICTMGEINYTLLDRTAILKMLSGGDPIPAERKNKEPHEFVNTAKLIINTNSVPQTADKTDAWYSRCVAIEFPNQFQMGKDIIDTIPDEEYDSLLTKCVRILKELLERGEFTNEGDIQEKETEYERLSNPLTLFMNTHCEKNPDYFEGAWRILERYEKFCAEQGFRKPGSKTEFNDMLRLNYEVDKESKKDYKTGKFENWVWVYGIRLKNLPVLPVLPRSSLNSPHEKLSETEGKTGKTGKNDGGVPGAALPQMSYNSNAVLGKFDNKPVTESSQQGLIQHIRDELISQAAHFPEGINEHLVASQAYRWDGATEEKVISAISHLIERGDVRAISQDDKGIRRVVWAGW